MQHREWVAVDDGVNRSLQMGLIYFFTKKGEKKKVVKLFVLVLFILATVQISEAAEENKPKEEKSFSNESSFSLVNTTGNSDTLALAGKNDMKYKFTDKWTGSWVAGALYNKSDGQKTAERYFTDLRADYVISERWYAYGLGSWLQDKFAGFENRYGIGPGIGCKFLIGPKHFLLGEAGFLTAMKLESLWYEGSGIFLPVS